VKFTDAEKDKLALNDELSLNKELSENDKDSLKLELSLNELL
jgi:hypothetical protein